MSKKQKEEETLDQENGKVDGLISEEENEDDTQVSEEESTEEGEALDPIKQAEIEVAEAKDKYLRLFSEFDNYKKRTIKERSELIKSAGEDIFQSILPILDDFDRAMKSLDEADDIKALKEGVDLIYNKLKSSLQQKGLEEMDSLEKEFDTDVHEAVTNAPAQSEELKGKVIDVLEKGYTLNGKVVRYAKVVVGN